MWIIDDNYQVIFLHSMSFRGYWKYTNIQMILPSEQCTVYPSASCIAEQHVRGQVSRSTHSPCLLPNPLQDVSWAHSAAHIPRVAGDFAILVSVKIQFIYITLYFIWRPEILETMLAKIKQKIRNRPIFLVNISFFADSKFFQNCCQNY